MAAAAFAMRPEELLGADAGYVNCGEPVRADNRGRRCGLLKNGAIWLAYFGIKGVGIMPNSQT